MKLSLIDIVQEILNDIDGEYVNSIGDTDEALQVASIVRSSFFDIIYRKDWPHLKKVAGLDSLSNSLYPTYLKLPERIFQLFELRYRTTRLGESLERTHIIKYMEPSDFLQNAEGYNNTSANVERLQLLDGTYLNFRNDRAPTYYTSFDDEHVVFDSYDKEVEDTLQGIHSSAIYYEAPIFKLEDSFVPDLPRSAFTGFIEEAKSAASVKVRQVEDLKAEQRAKRHSIIASQKSRRIARGTRYPNFGRVDTVGGFGMRNTKMDKWST